LSAVSDAGEVPAEHVGAKHQHERAVDVGFRLKDGVREAELLALVSVGDRDSLILFAVAVDDLFGPVPDDEFGRTHVDQVVEDVLNKWRPIHSNEDLRFILGEGVSRVPLLAAATTACVFYAHGRLW